jgi:hypothetical protein
VEVISDKKMSKLKSEIFERIKSKNLAELINGDSHNENIYNLDQLSNNLNNLKIINSENDNIISKNYINNKYLILDLRVEEEYNKFRIKEALCMPYFHLSQDKYIPKFYEYKNRDNKFIIVYHLDDKLSAHYSQLMIQKGINNIKCLTGGIEKFCKEYPELIEGAAPTELLYLKKVKKKITVPRQGTFKKPEKTQIINKIPKKEYLKQESIKNKTLTVQEKSNPNKLNNDKLTYKPNNYNFTDNDSIYVPSKINFEKKEITNKPNSKY